jgi:N-acetylglucosaminyldiphosphoundecaprenol N-acetyl-beta-D-mannosaminyltransferase
MHTYKLDEHFDALGGDVRAPTVGKMAISGLAPPDLSKPMFCIFGLAFDVVTFAEAMKIVELAASRGQKLTFSTPNVNMAVAVQTDPHYRDLVNRCDLVVMDGMPLVWLAKIMRFRVGRVAGSDLFDRLVQTARSEFRVFFLGGQPGVAEQASLALQRSTKSGLGVGVGGYSPGFGSAADMLTPETVAAINAAKPNMLVVSLGAAKGHEWIALARDKIDVPIISQLGAVVNFAAGTVKRSPRYLSNMGLEWLWRIYQEPELWSRYKQDAKVLGRLIVSRFIYQLTTEWRKPFVQATPGSQISFAWVGESCYLRLAGTWSIKDAQKLGTQLNQVMPKASCIEIDLTDVTYIDSTVTAVLIRLRAYMQSKGATVVIAGVSAPIKKILSGMCAEFLLQP